MSPLVRSRPRPTVVGRNARTAIDAPEREHSPAVSDERSTLRAM
ncbi:hypothetical protein [Haladaptatus sp. DYF46]|nr:hypothetical protein [Haladaptatus sp. DYF46]